MINTVLVNNELWTNYVKDVLTTESILEPLKEEVVGRGLSNRTLHGVIGLATEDKEYDLALRNADEVNAIEELGDSLWYLGVLDDELGFMDVDISDDIDVVHSDPLDLCKKVMFYGNDLDTAKLKRSLKHLAHQIFHAIEVIHNVEIEDVMKINIAKLRYRYPDKFSKRDSDVRDYKEEYEIMKKMLGR